MVYKKIINGVPSLSSLILSGVFVTFAGKCPKGRDANTKPEIKGQVVLPTDPNSILPTSTGTVPVNTPGKQENQPAPQYGEGMSIEQGQLVATTLLDVIKKVPAFERLSLGAVLKIGEEDIQHADANNNKKEDGWGALYTRAILAMADDPYKIFTLNNKITPQVLVSKLKGKNFFTQDKKVKIQAFKEIVDLYNKLFEVVATINEECGKKNWFRATVDSKHNTILASVLNETTKKTGTLFHPGKKFYKTASKTSSFKTSSKFLSFLTNATEPWSPKAALEVNLADIPMACVPKDELVLIQKAAAQASFTGFLDPNNYTDTDDAHRYMLVGNPVIANVNQNDFGYVMATEDKKKLEKGNGLAFLRLGWLPACQKAGVAVGGGAVAHPINAWVADSIDVDKSLMFYGFDVANNNLNQLGSRLTVATPASHKEAYERVQKVYGISTAPATSLANSTADFVDAGTKQTYHDCVNKSPVFTKKTLDTKRLLFTFFSGAGANDCFEFGISYNVGNHTSQIDQFTLKQQAFENLLKAIASDKEAFAKHLGKQIDESEKLKKLFVVVDEGDAAVMQLKNKLNGFSGNDPMDENTSNTIFTELHTMLTSGSLYAQYIANALLRDMATNEQNLSMNMGVHPHTFDRISDTYFKKGPELAGDVQKEGYVPLIPACATANVGSDQDTRFVRKNVSECVKDIISRITKWEEEAILKKSGGEYKATNKTAQLHTNFKGVMTKLSECTGAKAKTIIQIEEFVNNALADSNKEYFNLDNIREDLKDLHSRISAFMKFEEELANALKEDRSVDSLAIVDMVERKERNHVIGLLNKCRSEYKTLEVAKKQPTKPAPANQQGASVKTDVKTGTKAKTGQAGTASTTDQGVGA